MNRSIRSIVLLIVLLGLFAAPSSATVLRSSINNLTGMPGVWSFEIVYDVGADFVLKQTEIGSGLPQGWNFIAAMTPQPVATLRILGASPPFGTAPFLSNGELFAIDYLGGITGVSSSTTFYYAHTGVDPYGNPVSGSPVNGVYYTGFNIYGSHILLQSFGPTQSLFAGDGLATGIVPPMLMILDY